jgi:hypothetical protein
MSKALSKRIDIFLSVDSNTVNQYFNPHDPAPIYKRQLRHDFVQYMWESVTTYKKYSTIRFKVKVKEGDEQLTEPLMHAVRRHFYVREKMMIDEFSKFKKRNCRLLFMSLLVVMFCHGLLPYILSEEHRIHSTLSNSLDVFSWVILWKPIDKLIFQWNPYLKEISLLHKLANADILQLHEESKYMKMEACA